MNIATKTVATMMLIGFLTISTAQATAMASPKSQMQRKDRQLERMYRHHDRKMELRASVLGITPDELREKLKTQKFDQIIRQYGFRNQTSFHTAMVGKMKQELRARGWDTQKINDFMDKRKTRYSNIVG